MASKSNTLDFAGMDLVVNRVITGRRKAAKGNFKFPDTVGHGHIAGATNVINNTATATRTLTWEEAGSLVVSNKADGIVWTLPVPTAAEVGKYFDFFVATTITSNAFKISTGTQGTEFFAGTLVVMDSDGTVTSGAIFTGNGSTHDNISMNGTTTGGVAGTMFRVTVLSATQWLVTGYYVGSGTVVTPFATT